MNITDKLKPMPFEMNASSALDIAMTLDEAKAACQSSYPNSPPLVYQAAEEGSRSIASGKGKVLPIEALGLAMASCASTYSRSQKKDREVRMHLKNDEAYASHLSHLSAVHLALAQLQRDYTTSLSSTLLNRLARSQASIEALQTTERGTEAARVKVEAAEKRRDKARGKGDKNRRDAEEEVRMARATYLEALADLEARTEILRNSEQRGPCSGVAILKEYMDVHLAWIQAQHDVLSKARASLVQYPTCQDSAAPSIKTRAAPPPTPPSVPTVLRRIVEPPLLLRDEQRKRSVSSSAQMLHKPKLPSRASLNDVLLKGRPFKEEGRAEGPSLRQPSSTKEASSSFRLVHRIPFGRSESYSAIDNIHDGLATEASNKMEGKKGRIGVLAATFGRSSSSLGHTSPETAKMTPSTTGETGKNVSGGEKSSNWAGSLLSRKKESKKGGSYTVMMESEHGANQNRPVRSLSHDQETSTESRSGLDDILLVHHLNHSPSSKFGGQDETFSQSKMWETFGDRQESLGINSHLTGDTVSSEGSNPFGHEGGESSPVGTGNDYFSNVTRETYRRPQAGEDECDPADQLLGNMSSGTVRKGK